MKNKKYLVIAIIVFAMVFTAIPLFAEDADYWVEKGAEFVGNGEYEKGIECYTKAIEIDPDYAYYYYIRGWVYKLLERYDEAISDYTKAIELEPDFTYAYYDRGFAYERLGRDLDAQADFKKACDMGYEEACYELK